MKNVYTELNVIEKKELSRMLDYTIQNFDYDMSKQIKKNRLKSFEKTIFNLLMKGMPVDCINDVQHHNEFMIILKNLDDFYIDLLK